MAPHLPEDPRITAVGLFAEAYAGLTARFAAQLAQHQLAPVEFEVLIRLARSPESQLRMTDLSAQTGLTTSGVTRVVDRMQRADLVCRRSCDHDRRIAYAAITRHGEERLAAVLPGHLALIEQWFTGQLTATELAAFQQTLRKIRDAVRPGAVAGADRAPGTGLTDEPAA